MKEELMQTKAEETAPVPAEAKKKKLPALGKKGRKGLRRLVIVLVLAGLAVAWFLKSQAAPSMGAMAYETAQAQRRDVTTSVSGTATLEPADSYQVSTLLSATILSAPFEEGDLVEKDALLYTMDSKDAQDTLSRAGISVEQAQLSYQQAQEALNPTATIGGILNEVYVRNGDSVTAGTALAKIVASTDLSVDFLFTYVSPSQFYIGQSATVFVGNLSGSVQGTVTAVSDATSVTSNGKQSCTVRVKISNPGIVSDSFTASAVVGSYSSYGMAPVTMAASSVVYASGSGTVNGFDKLSGSTVKQGDVLCTLESESNRTLLKTAKLSLQSAQLSSQVAQNTLSDYSIRSPIAGTVIEKKCKTGDKMDGVSSGTMATIYDLSYLKMEMNVNELDIGSVQVGQQVELTAAAVPGETFSGTVEKVSINGTTTNGFTTYPVTVAIRDYGALKPGMNVSAEIIGESVENALTIPVSAVSRGNSVQVALEGALGPDGTTLADPTKVEERTVVLGANDAVYIEIRSGLAEGETVLLQPSDPTVGG